MPATYAADEELTTHGQLTKAISEHQTADSVRGEIRIGTAGAGRKSSSSAFARPVA
jgi:hypothetical protein